MTWDILILKILAVRPNGRAATSDISRELAIVDQPARVRARSHVVENGLFGAKLVTSPCRGIWQITESGRRYLDDHEAVERIPVQLAAE